MIGLKLLFSAEFPPGEWTDAPIRFVGKYAAGNPSGKDLSVKRDDGMVRVWNKYWLFGGSEPNNEEITYNFPNPFTENTKFQFYSVFCRFLKNAFLSFKSAVVRANSMPAFCIKLAFEGASSQCFISERLTFAASKGSSTS